MVVAVNPDFRGVGATIKKPFFAPEYFLLGSEHFFGFVSKCRGQVWQFLFEKSERASQRCAHGLVNRALCHGIERLWRKAAIFHAGGERKVQFTRALSDLRCLIRINASDQLIEEGTWRHSFILEVGFPSQHPFVVAAHGIQGERPNVAFVYGSVLQETNDSRIGLRPAIFECSEERWYIWKIGAFGQKAVYFHVGIHAVLQFAIKLKEEFVIKEHRRVALFTAQNVRFV